MIGLPAGIRTWLAVGVTDMHSGFNDLATKVQTALQTILSAAMSSYSEAGAATSSNYCGVLAMACACWRMRRWPPWRAIETPARSCLTNRHRHTCFDMARGFDGFHGTWLRLRVGRNSRENTQIPLQLIDLLRFTWR